MALELSPTLCLRFEVCELEKESTGTASVVAEAALSRLSITFRGTVAKRNESGAKAFDSIAMRRNSANVLEISV